MGLFGALVERRGLEKTFIDNPAEWLVQMYGGRASHSGITVTPTTAMQSSTVFACVKVSAEDLGALPLKVYRRLEGGGKAEDTTHPLYPILHDAPNPEQTSMDFRQMGQAHLLLRGNFYAEIVRNEVGAVKALWPIHPDRVRIERSGSSLVYVVTVPGGGPSAPGQPMRQRTEVRLAAVDVLHVRGLSLDGVLGLSPIQLAAEAIGLSLAAEAYGAGFFGRGANPSGVIERPKEAGAFKHADTIARLREQWSELYGGVTNAHRVAILEDGMSFKTIGIPNNHAQFLETREYQVGDIARLFRIPGVMIGHNDKTSTYASAEQFFLSYVMYHVTPNAVRWEQAIAQKLFTPRERRTHFAAFVVAGLLRGDTTSRYNAHWIGRQGGWLSADDIRELENMNPLPDGAGTVYWAPSNMVPADQIGQPPDDQNRGAEPAAVERKVTLGSQLATSPSHAAAHLAALFIADTVGRKVRREVEDVRRAWTKFSGDVDSWRGWVDGYYGARHSAHLSELLHIGLPAARAYASDHRAELLAEGAAVVTERWDIEAAGELMELIGLEEMPS